MSLRLHPDPLRSASHRLMASHLVGPYTAGAVDSEVEITVGGRAEVRFTAREPLLVAAPRGDLHGSSLRLTATLDPDGARTALSALEFAPYTEAGAYLPLHLPLVGDDRRASPFTLELTLVVVGPDGTAQNVAAGDVAGRLELRLVEGIFGRMLYVLGTEKARVRRQARELLALRRLATARDDALDRIGDDLGVARLSDALRFDAAATPPQIVTELRTDPAGRPTPEPDAEYRRRLGLFRRFRVPSPRGVRELLNGPGAPGDPNRGGLGELGFPHRFDVVEADNEFALAVHLIAAGTPAYRDNFLQYVRTVHLTWPREGDPGDGVHAARYLPALTKARVDAVRARVRAFFTFPPDGAVAPMLAAALARVAECRDALGDGTPWAVLRAQDATAGSRYELGLGVDVVPPAGAILDQMSARLRDAARPPAPDPAVERLLRSMTPASATDDPEGAWLLKPCGLRTVHRIDTGRLYLSNLPTAGMVITGPSTGAPGAQLPLEVRYEAPGEPGSSAVLVAALTAAATDWAAAGRDAWTVLSDADARSAWDQAVAATPAVVLDVFGAAALPMVKAPPTVVPRLKNLPGELIDTIRLPATQAARVVAGDPAAADELRQLVEIFRRRGVVSVLPLVTSSNEVLLVLGEIGLPEAGINLAERRSTGFLWYVVPIDGPRGQVKAVGSRTVFVPAGPGISAVVAIGYARCGLTDPYEFRVDLPPGALLNLQQYEFLMNVLERAFPIGVEVNTFNLRQRHVDLAGAGSATPLPPTLSRTYREFRRARQRGTVR